MVISAAIIYESVVSVGSARTTSNKRIPTRSRAITRYATDRSAYTLPPEESALNSQGATREKIMSVLAWIVLGLIAGFIASKIVNRSGEGALLDIVLGIVGAVVGGWLFHTFGMPGVTGLNIYSLVVAVVGAAVFLVIYHLISRGGSRGLNP